MDCHPPLTLLGARIDFPTSINVNEQAVYSCIYCTILNKNMKMSGCLGVRCWSGGCQGGRCLGRDMWVGDVWIGMFGC